MMTYRSLVSRSPWYPGWTIVAIAMTVQMLIYGAAVSSFTFWVASWQDRFHSLRAEIMMAPAILLFVTALLSPVIGVFLDRRSVAVVMSVGLLGFAVGQLLMTLATGIWPLVAIFSISMGVAVASAGPMVAQTLAMRWFGKRRGLANGIVLTGAPLGGVLISPLVVWLLARMEWERAAYLISLASLLLIIPVALLVRNSPSDAGVVAEPQATDTETSLDQRDWNNVQILASRNFWIMVVSFLPIYAAIMAVSKNFAPLFADHRFSAQDAALVYAIFSGLSVVGKILIGKLSDLYDSRFLMFLFISISAAGLLVMPLGSSHLSIICGAILIGLGSACFFPMQGKIISQYYGMKSFGRILGLLNLFFLLAGLATPLAGAIRDSAGSYDPFLYGSAVVLALSSAVIFGLRKPVGAPHHEAAIDPLMIAAGRAE